jgi:hypothetical protein
LKLFLLSLAKTIRESIVPNIRTGILGNKGTDNEVGRSLNALRESVLSLVTDADRNKVAEMLPPVKIGTKDWPYVNSPSALLLCDQLISLLEVDAPLNPESTHHGEPIESSPSIDSEATASRVQVHENNVKKEAERNRILIIHGHDERNLLVLKDLLLSKLQLPEPIIMAQQMIPGAALPEKFERLASRVEFAIALLTPDDLGGSLAVGTMKPRPRQNTLVEIGWFWGRLGRDRVLLLVKEELELPSDLQGVEFFSFREKVEEVSEKVRDFLLSHREA